MLQAVTPRFQTDQRAVSHPAPHVESTLDTAVVPIADNANFFASTLRTAAPPKGNDKPARKSAGKGNGKVVDVKVDVTAH